MLALLAAPAWPQSKVMEAQSDAQKRKDVDVIWDVKTQIDEGMKPNATIHRPTEQADLLAFTHVTVIDATGQPALSNRTVILAGDCIQSIGKFSETRVPKSARIIDASGKYMIPGLWDMHVHFRGGPALTPDNEASLSVFLANGITGVREMGGDIAETVFRWRAEIANGARLGPRILTSGPKLDGPKPAWPGSIPVTDPASARAAVDKLKAMGSDFVKIYAKDFPPDVFAALIDEARKQGLSVGGHLSFMTMRTRDAINGGVRFIEHADLDVLAACSRSEKQLDDEYVARLESKAPISRIELEYRYARTYDEAWARELVAELIQHDVWVTPTLAVMRQLESVGRVDYEQHPERKYIFPGMWQTWNPKLGRRHPYTDDQLKQLKLVDEKTAVLVKLMQSLGVGLLAGSDSGASNNFTFPGWTLHRELELLVESGLSPMEALQTATRNPARFLGELRRNGTVEEGKAANLVLLTANPLEDIRNTRKIDATILKGKLLTRADLDKLLQDVATKVAVAAH
jgi:imidazolonepropionase-like amidohydrolase